MQYRTLGNTDLKRIHHRPGHEQLWQSEPHQRPRGQQARDRQVPGTLASTSSIRRTSTATGRARAHIGEALKGRRNEAIIGTKFNLTKPRRGVAPGSHHEERRRESYEASD